MYTSSSVYIFQNRLHMPRSRTPSPHSKRKDKKGKKDRKKYLFPRLSDDSVSSGSAGRDRNRKDRKKEKDRKRKSSKSRQRDFKKKELDSVPKRSHSRSRSRDRAEKKAQTEEDRIRKMQKRRVLAKLMAMNANYSKDSDDEAPPNPPPKPSGSIAQPANPASASSGAPSQPAVPDIFQAPKKSKWQKSVLPASAKPAPVAAPVVAPAAIQPAQQQSKLKPQQPALSLEVNYPSDEQQFLRLVEEKSIEVEKPMRQEMDIQEDPLENYMKEITGNAVKQMELPKKGRQNIVTFEDVLLTKDTYKDESEDDQKYKKEFLNAVKKFNKDQGKDAKGHVMDDDDNREDAEDFLLDKEEQLDFFAKQRKMAERKELNQVDHQQNQYKDVNFKFYREAEEIKNMDPAQVDKYRKEAGDIKVRGRDILNPVFNWYQCGFSDRVLSVIEKRQYKKPFPIQAQSFPLIMNGRDVIGIAQTGSGKTLAYLLPLIRHVQDQPKVVEGQGPIALIMTPTRQLARQVYAQCKIFCKHVGIECLAVYGGAGVQNQLSDLRKGAEIIICTPGRMIDVLTLNNGKITNLRRVTMIVIDEADRMFDLGFEPQITKIMNNVRPNRQTVMFSATFPKNVENLAKRILKRPVEVIVGSRGQACMNIQQIIEVRQQTTKLLRLLEILGTWNDKGSILIFVDKQSQADLLLKQLVQYGYYCLVLHGAMDHTDRQFTIYDFKKGVRNIMIATSVCARGLDIKSIVLVVNFKCPNHLQDYIHRIGRTGRAGNKGTAITFITPTQEQYSIDLVKALEMAGVEPPEDLKKMSQDYLSKVSKGEARKIRNRNIQGQGFKFDEDEEDQAKTLKDMIKKQIKNEVGGFSDSDDEDIEKQKKREEDRRGRKDQQQVAEAIKDPETKTKLIAEAMKAVSEAIKNGVPMTTEKLLQIAVNQMKEAVSKHKIIRTVDDGIAQVEKVISEIQNKNNKDGETTHFSFDFEINDYPLPARQKTCQPQYIKSIQQLTNCRISMRGQYIQPTKKPPAGTRKLYLQIQGQNKHYVSSAFREIKRTIEEASYEVLQIGAMGKY